MAIIQDGEELAVGSEEGSGWSEGRATIHQIHQQTEDIQ